MLYSVSRSQPWLNSALCPVHWSVHHSHPFIFVFFALYRHWNHCSHPIFLLSFFFLDKVHRYMRWLWWRGDHIVGLLEINSRISVLLVLNEYFGLCFLFLTNPFATLISTIPWWVTKLSTNDITYLLQGNRGCRRTATATPNRDCGCSRGLQQLFDSDCYGDGPNHVIFVTRIKAVFGSLRHEWNACQVKSIS